MKLDANDLEHLVLEVAAERFGDSAFRRRALMDAVAQDLRARQLWESSDSEMSRSTGRKSLGLAAIDFRIRDLARAGKLYSELRDSWRVKTDLLAKLLNELKERPVRSLAAQYLTQYGYKYLSHSTERMGLVSTITVNANNRSLTARIFVCSPSIINGSTAVAKIATTDLEMDHLGAVTMVVDRDQKLGITHYFLIQGNAEALSRGILIPVDKLSTTWLEQCSISETYAKSGNACRLWLDSPEVPGFSVILRSVDGMIDIFQLREAPSARLRLSLLRRK